MGSQDPMGCQDFPEEKGLGSDHRQKGSETLGVALGNSISKEEKATGAGLSLVPGTHPPSAQGLAFTPCRAGVGWGRKERCEAQAGDGSQPGGKALWGLMWPQNQSLVPKEWGSSTPRLSLHTLSPL